MKWFTSPRVMVWIHAIMTGLWVLALIPTLLWWRESILWVAFMSLYANIVGHWSCWQAVRAELNPGGVSRE